MKKRILYLHRTQGQGAEGSHIRGMVDGFRGVGYDVDILGPPGIDPYASVDHHPKETKQEQSSIVKLILSKLSSALPQIVFELMEVAYNFYAYPRVKNRLRQYNYDFIYERYALNTFFGSSLAVKHGIPLVLEVNDATVIERSRPLVLCMLAEKFEKKVLKQASLIVTISNTFKELLVEAHNIPAEKILVLPNAVNPDHYRLDPEKRIARETLGMREDQIVLGCAGAFVPWHGLAFMLDSLHELIREKDLFVLFIGDGPVRADVEALAKKYNISNKVLFTGFVDAGKVPYYLDLVDICVIPDSNDHGSPMKLFEYMAMGKPTVLPNYKPLLETITHNKEGVFFEKNNSASLQSALLSLVKETEKITEIGENARGALESKFTWCNNIRRVLLLIK